MSAKAQHACRAKSFEVSPVAPRQCGGDDVPRNHDFATKKTHNIIALGLDGDKFRYRLAMFSDHHRLVLGLNLVHDREAMRIERTRCHLLHAENSLLIWSLYRGYIVLPVRGAYPS